MAYRIQLPPEVADGWRGHKIAGIGWDNQVYLCARSNNRSPPKFGIFRGSRFVPKTWEKLLEVMVEQSPEGDFNDFFVAGLSDDDDKVGIISHETLINPKFYLVDLCSHQCVHFSLTGRKASSSLCTTLLGWATFEYYAIYSDDLASCVANFYKIVPEDKTSVIFASADNVQDMTITHDHLFAYNNDKQILVYSLENPEMGWRRFDLMGTPPTSLHFCDQRLLSMKPTSTGYQISEINLQQHFYRLVYKGIFVRPGYPHLLGKDNWIGLGIEEDGGKVSYVRLFTRSHWQPLTLRAVCTINVQKMFAQKIESKYGNYAWSGGISAKQLQDAFNYRLKNVFP